MYVVWIQTLSHLSHVLLIQPEYMPCFVSQRDLLLRSSGRSYAHRQVSGTFPDVRISVTFVARSLFHILDQVGALAPNAVRMCVPVLDFVE